MLSCGRGNKIKIFYAKTNGLAFIFIYSNGIN